MDDPVRLTDACDAPLLSTDGDLAEAPVVDIAEVACWRCGKRMRITSATCPVCRAAVRHALPTRDDAAIDPDIAPASNGQSLAVDSRGPRGADVEEARPPIVSVLYFFLALLCLSVVEGLVAHAMFKDKAEQAGTSAALRGLITAFEVVDSVLIVVAVFCMTRPPATPMALSRRVPGWLAGPPLLAGALLANVAYHFVLKSYLRTPPWAAGDESMMGASIGWLTLAICVQPAIFEELFFRHLTLGHLRGVMGVHAAVWVSSLIFGLAHLGAPLSMPILTLIGVALGYARVASGGLVLPMLMHGAHNAVIVYLETHR